MMEGKDEENTFKILLATDIHLGYLESDPIRGDDSFNTFEEILSIGKSRDVDFVLLGGDLFHVNKPSRKATETCIQLVRKYSLGDKPVQFEFLSDQTQNFLHSSFPQVNYLDPNLNIGMPVFSIHGNHDDPAGQGNKCALDVLSSSGLINHFGRTVQLESILISPLLMQKGSTKLALYGLGSVRDERLHRLFRESKVTMLRPLEDTDSWFNLFVLHQNRAKHGVTNYIPENYLDSFIDLVFWGHEHECRIKPEYNDQASFYVTQPGSPIATALSAGEAVPKHVGILHIRNKEFRIEPIPLLTVRQFLMDTLDLSNSGLKPNDPNLMDNVFDICCQKVDALLEEAAQDHSGNPKQPKLPLIRLRVDYTSKDELFNVVKFGQKYMDKVANCKDIILFKPKIISEKKDRKSSLLLGSQKDVLQEHNVDSVEELVTKYFSEVDDNLKLKVISETGMAIAIDLFKEKGSAEVIGKLINHQMSRVRQHLVDKNTPVEKLDEEILSFRNYRLLKRKEEESNLKDTLDRMDGGELAFTGQTTTTANEDGEQGTENTAPSRPASGRRGRGRGSTAASTAAPRARGATQGTRGRRGRGAQQASLNFTQQSRASSRSSASNKNNGNDDSDDDIMIVEDDVYSSSSSRRTAASRPRAGSFRSTIVEEGDSESENPF